MSIIGGAAIPVLQGLTSDMTGSMQTAFIVSLVCFCVVLIYFAYLQKINLQDK